MTDVDTYYSDYVYFWQIGLLGLFGYPRCLHISEPALTISEQKECDEREATLFAVTVLMMFNLSLDDYNIRSWYFVIDRNQ